MTDPRQQSDEVLYEQREWLRVTPSSIGDAVITTDTEGRVTFLNPVAQSLTGWTQEDAAGKPLDIVFRIINETTRRTVANPATKALGEGVALGLANHTLLIAIDGTERPIGVSASPIRNTRGEVAGVVLVFRDVSERRRQEQQVQDTLAYADNIIATLREPFLVLDKNLRVKTANRSFYQDFHVTLEETQGRYIFDLGDGQWNIPRLRLLLEEVLSHDHSVHDFEVEHAFPVLGQRTMLLNARRFLPDSKQTELILLAIEDTTERKRLANDLRKYADDLSEADRRKNEFLAMLAHELRNPLAPIRNALQIMRLTGGDSQTVQLASEMMERQTGQMVRLVDDLLDVSRISRGTIELRRGRIELASTIRHAVEAVRPLYKEMNHELTVTLPPQPIYLNADPTRLAQVVGNLLNNASKFTDRGGRISLTVGREREEAVIRVRDSGIGIAPEDLHRVFNMFVQVDTSLERSVSGLGIGLTLVKNLVEMHGGTVEAKSGGNGQGSEFVVRLPIMVELLKPVPPETTGSEPTTTTARRILVVDDNRDSATSLAMLLKLTGNETNIAYDGLEAVESAATFKPDVVLCDIGLPKLNGYETCRRIREQPWGKNILMIALTGWGQEEDREKSRDAGFNSHMVKPVDFDALMKLLAGLQQAKS